MLSLLPDFRRVSILRPPKCYDALQFVNKYKLGKLAAALGNCDYCTWKPLNK